MWLLAKQEPQQVGSPSLPASHPHTLSAPEDPSASPDYSPRGQHSRGTGIQGGPRSLGREAGLAPRGPRCAGAATALRPLACGWPLLPALPRGARGRVRLVPDPTGKPRQEGDSEREGQGQREEGRQKKNQESRQEEIDEVAFPHFLTGGLKVPLK